MGVAAHPGFLDSLSLLTTLPVSAERLSWLFQRYTWPDSRIQVLLGGLRPSYQLELEVMGNHGMPHLLYVLSKVHNAHKAY